MVVKNAQRNYRNKYELCKLYRFRTSMFAAKSSIFPLVIFSHPLYDSKNPERRTSMRHLMSPLDLSVEELDELLALANDIEHNPVKYAHIVTSTTHKTLRGPRGGIILMGKDFDNPWGLTTPKGVVKKMSQILNSSVFPGIQGGPLEHCIAAKAVAFYEALQPEFKEYQKQVIANCAALAEAFSSRGYKIVSGGTDNHLILIDLRSKFSELTGKVAEKELVKADITVNKNMVPFDSRSPFQTSGIRVGTPAITTRGLKENDMIVIVDLIDRILSNIDDENTIAQVKKEVNAMMNPRPMFAW